MITLSAFADEISPDLQTQLANLSREKIRHLEFRGVWNTNVLTLTPSQLTTVHEQVTLAGVRVSAIGSPIGKIAITDEFAPHLLAFEKALHVAQQFATPYIRIFSFFIPEESKPTTFRDEVLRRLHELVRLAERSGIILLHENEKHIYGDTPERCLDILHSIGSPNLRMAFDPANFVQCGVRPMIDAYPLLADFIEYVHIKDALFEGGCVVPSGQGDGDLPTLIHTLKQRNYTGFLSLEPHLESANAYSGFSGPALFSVASQALKAILEEAQLPWS